MQKIFEQLSLEYNTESSKEWKRVRALFGVPVRDFFKISPTINRLLVGFLKIEGSKTTVKMSSNQTLNNTKSQCQYVRPVTFFSLILVALNNLRRATLPKKSFGCLSRGRSKKALFGQMFTGNYFLAMSRAQNIVE